MDQFLHMIVYSKMFENISPYTAFILISMYIFQHFLPYIRLYYWEHLLNKDECSIQIPYHKKNYTTGQNKTTKTHYSPLFMAINHYIKKNANTSIFSFIEIMNFENVRWSDDNKSEYILLPNQSNRILICKEHNIYIEILIENENTDDDKKETQPIFQKCKPNFIFNIIKKGKENLHVLNEFVKTCQETYEKEITKIKEPMVYEYIKSYKDDDGNVTMKFDASPFKSNKTFENLFFECKENVLKDIRKFSKYMSPDEKDIVKSHYKRIGKPYKQIYLLYGLPGTGKSSLIKAFANETGRHCTLVQWSRIKTADDFGRLCHQMKVDSNKIPQSDNIIVFEDFDANNSSTVKIRDNLIKSNTDLTDLTDKHKLKQLLERLETKSADFLIAKDDELTLECVLNTLDGIKELHDAIIVFTTNDIASLDPALIRPGRIDRTIEMKLASIAIIKDMLRHHYQLSSDKILKSLDTCKGSLSPAKIQELCDTHKDIHKCIQHVKKEIA